MNIKHGNWAFHWITSFLASDKAIFFSATSNTFDTAYMLSSYSTDLCVSI